MRLRQLKARYPDRIRLAHRAFMLLPEDQPNRTFTPYYLQHRAAARRLTGLPLDLPPVGAPYPRSSRWALEAAKWVERRHPEAFEAFDLALFEAFFGETRDISDIAVLADLAGRRNLPAAELAEALRAHAFTDAVWADHREALEAGVTGIPTVLVGGHALSGAVAFEEYERAARPLLTIDAPPPPTGPSARRRLTLLGE